MAAPDAPVAVDLVHDMLHEPLFRTSDIGKERSVIREEISMYENDPASALWDLVNATAFEGTSLAGPIAGTAEDVGFSPATIKGFFRAHYVPERLVVVLTGAVDDALFALAEKKFSTLRGTFRGTGIAPLAEPRRAGVTFKPGKTDRLHVTVRFPGAPIRCRDRWAHDLLAMILGGYSSSRLNQTVREDKGLCYSVGASSHSHHDVGSLFVGTEIMPDKLDAAMKVIAQVLRRLQPNGLTTDELQAAKRHLRGSRLMANDKPMSQAMNVAYQLCATNTYVSLDAELRAYQRTTLGQVNAVAASLRPENALVCVVGPKESRKDVFNAWDASWNVRGRAGQRTVKRLADGVHDTFLVESST
jgi:predicted Zn-dependent peptidase